MVIFHSSKGHDDHHLNTLLIKFIIFTVISCHIELLNPKLPPYFRRIDPTGEIGRLFL